MVSVQTVIESSYSFPEVSSLRSNCVEIWIPVFLTGQILVIVWNWKMKGWDGGMWIVWMRSVILFVVVRVRDETGTSWWFYGKFSDRPSVLWFQMKGSRGEKMSQLPL